MSYNVTKKVTCKSNNNGSACNSAKVNGLFRESFSQYEKKNSHFEVSDEVLTESATRLERDSEINSSEIERRLVRNLVPETTNRLYNEGRSKLFTSLMARAYMESLEVPMDVIQSLYGNILSVCESFTNGKYNLLEENHSRNVVLEGMYELCESTAKEVAKAKCDGCKSIEEMKTLKFDLDQDQEKEFLDNSKKIDFATVAGMVKDKMVSVVKDEQERAAKRQELHTDIEEDVNKAAVQEGLSKLGSFFSPLVENYRDTQRVEKTLFESLMESCASELMESIVTTSSGVATYAQAAAKGEEDCGDEIKSEDLPGSPSSQKTLTDMNDDIRKVDEFQGKEDEEDDVPEAEEILSEGCNKKKAVKEGCCKEGTECDCDKHHEEDEDDENHDEEHDDDDEEPIMEKKPCEEALKIKQHIHKRAMRFKNKVFKRALKESVEESNGSLDMDEVFMESMMNYTMIELVHTLGLDTMDHDKVKALIHNNVSKIKK